MIERLLELELARELVVFVVSMVPVVELRGALPVAINLFGMSWHKALALSVVGNLLPVPFLLLFLDSMTGWLSQVGLSRRMMDWVFERTRKQGRIIERYERVGLMLFVAVPLPMTGAWMGSIAAFLLGLGFNRSLISIAVGVVIAGVIVTCLCLLGWLGAVIAGVGLCAAAVAGLWKV
jgi:uncharacterized membrane protein